MKKTKKTSKADLKTRKMMAVIVDQNPGMQLKDPLTFTERYHPLGRTYLLQRMRKADPKFKRLQHAWGGSESGLTDKMSIEVAKIVQVDYMGAAEYEFGEFAKSIDVMRTLAKAKLMSEVFCVVNRKPFWLVAPKGTWEDIRNRLKIWMDVEYWNLPSEARMRDNPYLREAVLKVADNYINTLCAWLDLHNHFLITTDREIAEGWAKLIGIKTVPRWRTGRIHMGTIRP